MAVSDGIKNGRWVNGPPQEIGAYVTKIGQKRRSALFIITGATSSTARPSGGEIKPLWDFLRCATLQQIYASDVEEAHCICISTCTNERIQLAASFCNLSCFGDLVQCFFHWYLSGDDGDDNDNGRWRWQLWQWRRQWQKQWLCIAYMIMQILMTMTRTMTIYKWRWRWQTYMWHPIHGRGITVTISCLRRLFSQQR